MDVGFRYLLVLEDGETADPAIFVTATPEWGIGGTFITSDGSRRRILGFVPETEVQPLDRVWQVEAVPGRT